MMMMIMMMMMNYFLTAAKAKFEIHQQDILSKYDRNNYVSEIYDG